MSALPMAMQLKKEKMLKEHQAQQDQTARKLSPINKVSTQDNVYPIGQQPVENTNNPSGADTINVDIDASSLTPEVNVGNDGQQPITPTETPTSTINWEEESKKNEARWKSLRGVHDTLLAENRDMRSRFASLELQLLEVSKPKAPPVVEDPNEYELTPEEQEDFKDSLPVLNKLLSKRDKLLRTQAVEPLLKEIESLKNHNKSVIDKFAATEDQLFSQRVYQAIPDFNDVTSTAEWAAFVDKPISPYSELKIRDVLWNEGQLKRNVGVIAKAIEDFKSSKSNPYAKAYSAPQINPSSQSALPPTQKPPFKVSTYKNSIAELTRGRKSLEDHLKIKDLYKEAEAEGRLAYD